VNVARQITQTKNIIVIGFKGSGKSTYLAVLSRALASCFSNWRITPTGDITRIKLNELMDFVFAQGIYPPGTAEEFEMTFRVEKEASMFGLKPGARFQLKTGDLPGEMTKGVGSKSAMYRNFYERSLKGCDGIIFLLDPTEYWRQTGEEIDQRLDVYFPLFTSILSEIEDHLEDKWPYMAFCITKLDLNGIDEKLKPNGDFDKNGVFDDVENLAAKILGHATKNLIDHSVDRNHLRWCPVSATGYTGEGSNRTTQYYSKKTGDTTVAAIRNPRELVPIGVAESLEWVLDNLADDDEDVLVNRFRGNLYAKFDRKIRKLFNH